MAVVVTGVVVSLLGVVGARGCVCPPPTGVMVSEEPRLARRVCRSGVASDDDDGPADFDGVD